MNNDNMTSVWGNILTNLSLNIPAPATMNRLDFLYGRSFNYNGSFSRLTATPISYDAQFNDVTDTKAECHYTVQLVTDDGFLLFNRAFGRIAIAFKQCSVLMPCTMCKVALTDNIYQGHITCRQCADKLRNN
jgi:hypothetical protein